MTSSAHCFTSNRVLFKQSFISTQTPFFGICIPIPTKKRVCLPMAEIELKTAPADFRFPSANQTKHCFTRYIEFHKCLIAKGNDSGECEKFARFYRSLCPVEWIEKWDEQRENGTFAGPL